MQRLNLSPKFCAYNVNTEKNINRFGLPREYSFFCRFLCSVLSTKKGLTFRLTVRWTAVSLAYSAAATSLQRRCNVTAAQNLSTVDNVMSFKSGHMHKPDFQKLNFNFCAKKLSFKFLQTGFVHVLTVHCTVLKMWCIGGWWLVNGWQCHVREEWSCAQARFSKILSFNFSKSGSCKWSLCTDRFQLDAV